MRKDIEMSVYKLRYGTPESITPSSFSPAPLCEIIGEMPEAAKRITFSSDNRGCVLTMPIDPAEGIYGFGLQLNSFRQNGKKKQIRPNADPRSDCGDTHAPVPFFVTTAGFGIYVDTARYASFYCGKTKKAMAKAEDANGEIDFNTIYSHAPGGEMIIEIPVAQGVDVYYITGEKIVDIVSQYNLLSGGGCMPPLWGLGNFYRCDMTFNAEQVMQMADKFRESEIPCDIIGLEPGWQSHAYSCSYVWDSTRFPKPDEFVAELNEKGFHVNLWEHAFTNPASPIYDDLIPHSGDYLVWNGLVPDFATEGAREVFTSIQKKLIDIGIDGFKLDECDGSDFTGGWSFPNRSQFPSGLDGEQYHSLFGLLYSKTMQKALGDKRTLSEVRNMGSLAASYPFVLYSDLYGHKEFLTGVVNSGFSGIMWSPEVRHAENAEDLIRRVQSVVFSVQSLINAFYLPEFPWVQHGCTDEIRKLFELRVSLLPYLYTAFYDYKTLGKPPVRALVSDYEREEGSHYCDQQWLFGDSIIVAPIIYPAKERDVWLPDGVWYDLFTNEKYVGGTHRIVTDNIPVFVKSGTVLPFAKPVQFLKPDTQFELTLRAYGDCTNSAARLIEDDGVTYSTNYRVISVKPHESIDSFRYKIIKTENIV